MTRKKKPGLRKLLITSSVLLIIFICISLLIINNILNSKYAGYEKDEKFILINKGMPVSSIINLLVREGVLKDKTGIKILLRIKGGEAKFRAGEYLFDRPISPMEVYEKFVSGDIYYHKITVIEGYDKYDLAKLLESRGLIPENKTAESVNNVSLITPHSPDAMNLEGYLFPDTYLISRTMNADDIIKLMVNTFLKKYNNHFDEQVKKTGFTLHKIITIASLIEKEASMASEKPIISSVIHNRLRIGMGLQIDPTIIYALKSTGQYDGNLKRKHKKFDSKYNTYKHAGLPPGPICSPGLDSIIAACNPEKTKFIYYVSKNDGSHVFAKTVAEHNRNVYIWQKKYWVDKWRKERLEKQKEARNGKR